MGVSEDGLLLVEELLGEIVQQAGNTVYRHHLQRRVVPYAVQRARADALAVVEWLYIQHDQRSEDHSDAAFSDEPEPCPVDSWARGVLDCTTAPRPSTPPPSFLLSSQFSSQNEKSLHPSNSLSPPQAQRPATMPFPSSSKNNNSTFQKSAKPKQALPQNNKPLAKQPVPVRTAIATAAIGQISTTTTTTTTTSTTTVTSSSARSHAVESKKQSTKAVPSTNATKDSNKAKINIFEQQEDESEKFAKFKRDIRNRDYFYDHNGNIVIVNQADYDKFPNTNKANMKVAIIPSAAEPTNTPTSAPASMAGGRSHPGSPQRRKKQQEPFKPSLASPPSNKFYKEIKLAQPTMMDNGVKIAPGVTLHPVERRKETSTPSPPRALIRKKEAPPQPQPQPPQQPKPEPMLPAIPVPSTSHPLHHHHPPPPSSNNNNNNTLTLSPTALYGSTQKMWTTEMLSDNFNSLLPSIKPRTPSSAPPFSGFT